MDRTTDSTTARTSGRGAPIKLIKWAASKLSGLGLGLASSASSDSPNAEGSGVHHDLNQEWEAMDELRPWAEDEIDRLQDRLHLNESGKRKL